MSTLLELLNGTVNALTGGDITFQHVWYLLLLPLPVLARLTSPARQRQPGRALRVVSLEKFDYAKLEGRFGKGLSSGLALAFVIWALVVLASARPQLLGEPVPAEISGRDLMLCIDISGSMREQDMLIGQRVMSRMQAVRQVGSDFIARRNGDRIGLIMFGAQAYVQTPLTLDHDTVQHFLQEAEVGLAGRSTAIGDAIGLGIKRLRERSEDSRVLILLTDGENSAGVVDPLEAAQVAADSGIRIHTIGVGSERGGISAFGIRVPRSDLDEQTLRSIADTTGGQFFRARDPAELERIYAQIDQIEPVDQEEQSLRPITELFPWFLGLALLLSVPGAWVYRWRLWC